MTSAWSSLHRLNASLLLLQAAGDPAAPVENRTERGKNSWIQNQKLCGASRCHLTPHPRVRSRRQVSTSKLLLSFFLKAGSSSHKLKLKLFTQRGLNI